MNTSIKMVIALTIIAMFSGGVLSGWESYTKPMIEQHKLEELKSAIAVVLPPHDHYDEIKGEGKDGLTLYVGKKDGSDEPVGIAFEAVGNGFQGKVVTMVGLTPDFTHFTGIKVLEQVETPGLGTKVVEDPSNKKNPTWWPDQFKGVLTLPAVGYVKNKDPEKPNEIRAISGATITSKSVVRILNDTIKKARKLYESKTGLTLPTEAPAAAESAETSPSTGGAQP